MRIILYVKPGDDPNAIAEQAKRIIEANTGEICNVRVTGTPINQGSEALEEPLGY